jgi:fucose permease
VAAGVGAVSPLAVGLAFALGSWRPALLVLLPVVGVLAVLSRSVPLPADRGPRRGDGAGTRLSRHFWVTWLVVTAGIGVEFCLTLWAADMLAQRTTLTAAGASAAVTALVAGMCVGRVVGGRLALRLPVDRLLYGALVVNAVGFALFWLSTDAALAVLGLLGCGLGVALYFPLGLSRAIAASDGQPDRASARVGIGAAVASGAGPFLLGALADATTIHTAMLVVPGLLVVAAVGIRLAPARTAVPAAG